MTETLRTAGLLLAALAAAAIAFSLTSCGDDKATLASLDDVTDAWRKAGLEPTALEPLEATDLGKGDCGKGAVSGVEVIVCSYPDQAAAEAARAAGLARVGSATGAALVEGRLLLIARDAEKVDPSGRAINRITKTFRRR